jgi:tetratricopeptide (TPR) repeat protein/2-polyprenyl-3-methyl-5-hydroxy-6-metoxy-1,4-benzoquinol methylase
MNRKERRAAGKMGTLPSFAPQTAHLLDMAYRMHQSGHVLEAERAYRDIIKSDPNNFAALQLLGVLCLQSGRPQMAVELIERAIGKNGQIAELHYNLGSALAALGRLPDALSRFAEAVRLKPQFAEAHFEIGSIRLRLNERAGAEAALRQALALRPDFADAANNLGITLMQLGRVDEAMDVWQKLLGAHPNYASAHLNIGLAFQRLGRLDDALAEVRKALALNPNYAEAEDRIGELLQLLGRRAEAAKSYRRVLQLRPDALRTAVNLGTLLLADGNIAEAMTVARRALTMGETQGAKDLFVQCAIAGAETLDLEPVRDLLLRALNESWARPSSLWYPCARLVMSDLIKAGPDRLSAVAAQPLMLSCLTLTRVANRGIEELLTGLRRSLLDAVTAGNAQSDAQLNFACALAQQCFINEYVFAQDADESAKANALHDKISVALDGGLPISAAEVAALGCYMALDELAGAALLLKRKWPQPLRAVLDLQIRQPLREHELRDKIPALTPIADGVSRAVREQYEANPYPRWIKPASQGGTATLDSVLRAYFPLAYRERPKSGPLQILSAGCGTGQHLLELARQFTDATLLAVDLSLSSLSYAKRQAEAIGIDNIEFAQADITQLGSLERRFDVIESSGVLHHVADPFAAWKTLSSLLRSGGAMQIALYSESARADIVAARNFVAERGFAANPAGIRQCREEMFAAADGTALKNVTTLGDFYTMSECRDLLFHVQEHRHTLPQIKAFLAEQELEFLGFRVDGTVLARYAQRFPDDRAMTNLDNWHRFEEENPITFIGMYVFWIQKKA